MLSGDEAEARLADPDFERDWNVLHQACPWSTPYQGSPFVRTWLDVYKTKFVPIIIYEYSADVLVGLLLLARPSDGMRTIAHIGTHHAEYQTWLATAEVSDRFIEGALKMLKAGKLAKSLRFLFLAPGTPIAWTGATARTGLPTSVRLHRRGRMRLDKVTGHLSPLRKKSNKSRLSRLKKHGTVQLEFLEGSEKLEKELDKIADYCDLRQCAAYGVMPFRADPLKRVFYLALADVDGLLHATVLKVGNDVVAAHLGVADASSVSLGVITHAPQHGSSSPGKLIIYLLVDMLSEQGREWFDLTPGGSYKDRFATEFDDVFVLDVFLSPAAYLQYALRRAAVAYVRSLARLATPVRARIERQRVSRNAQSAAVHSVHPRDPSTLSRQISASVDSNGKELVIFRCEFGQTPSMSTNEALNVNRIQDLLDYKKKSREMPDIQNFMMQSSNRLDNGEVAFTYSDNGILLHCSWISNVMLEPDHPSSKETDRQSAVLWDDPHLRFSDPHRQVESVLYRLVYARDCMRLPTVFVAAASTDKLSLKSLNQLGLVAVSEKSHFQSGPDK